METIDIIYAAFLVLMLIIYGTIKLVRWARQIEEFEMPDHSLGGESNNCSQAKIDAYKMIKDALNSCRTKPQFESVYNMLITFRQRYGKCEMHAELYAEYLESKWDFTERNNLQYFS